MKVVPLLSPQWGSISLKVLSASPSSARINKGFFEALWQERGCCQHEELNVVKTQKALISTEDSILSPIDKLNVSKDF